MHVPTHFRPDDDTVHELLAGHGAADLVTATARGPMASTVPMVYHRDRGARGVLSGHLARVNPQWRAESLGEAMVVVRGPDHYVSPSWYPSKARHGRVVPTWNHVTAHVFGTLTVHDDPAWLAAQVRDLTDHHEAGRRVPWSVDDAPEEFVTGLLRALVGVELHISRVEATVKLSQNRSSTDVDGVVEGLASVGDTVGAREVERHRVVRENGARR